MYLLKNLLPLWLFPLAIAFCFKTDTTNTSLKKDTIKVYSTGINNQIVIDSIHLKDSLNEVVLPLIKGKITQAGQNNSVEIKTGDKTLGNKNRIANNRKTSTIKITQTGKNNSVKINSR